MKKEAKLHSLTRESEESIKMKQKQKVLITFLVLVLVVAAFYFITMAITQYTGYTVNLQEESNLEGFAKCLSSIDARMYGAYWCPHCQNQEDLFGKNETGKQLLIDNRIYYECDPRGENSQSQECLNAGIQGYPTWQIKGKLYPGEQSLKNLAELSGCGLSNQS